MDIVIDLVFCCRLIDICTYLKLEEGYFFHPQSRHKNDILIHNEFCSTTVTYMYLHIYRYARNVSIDFTTPQVCHHHKLCTM